MVAVQCEAQIYRDNLLKFLNTTIRVPMKIYVDVSITQRLPELFSQNKLINDKA